LGRYTDPKDIATLVGFGAGTAGSANSAFDVYEASRIAAEGKPAKGGEVKFNGKVKK
jgi:hypothetical protein